MEVTWTVVPVGNGEFQLTDHHGKKVTVVTRKLEVWFAGYAYIDEHRGEEDAVDMIAFEGIDLIPSFMERWTRRFTRWFA